MRTRLNRELKQKQKRISQIRKQFNMAKDNYLKTGDIEYGAQMNALEEIMQNNF